MPTTIGATKAANPINGLGKPKSAACSDNITDLQLIKGEMSQAVAASGSPATLIRSSVKPKLAIQPRIPNPISVKGNTMSRLSHFDNNRVILFADANTLASQVLVEHRFHEMKI